jgi:two-component system response regulator BaeR
MTAGPSRPARIAVVEDEADIAGVVRDYLRHAGHTVRVWGDGQAALAGLLAEPPDLVVLDVMLPGLDGVGILRRLRAEPVAAHVPVIMLTARVEELDRLLALDAGADDYVCKPFSPRELVARVHAVLRRLQRPVPGEVDERLCLAIDTQARRLSLGGQVLNLTPKEYGLIAVLSRTPNRVYSRQHLLDAVYADELDVSDRAVDSHIKNLRRKLAECQVGGGDWIRSVYGVGFALELPDHVRLLRV